VEGAWAWGAAELVGVHDILLSAQAKCYIYRSSGYCSFVIRVFTHVGEGGNEMYLMEMQRRKVRGESNFVYGV
jgi:hypothetical protein